MKFSRWALACWAFAAAAFLYAAITVPRGTETQGQWIAITIMLTLIGLMLQVCRK